MSTLGQRLKELRENSNLTQQQIADILNLKSWRSVAYVEADKRGFDHHPLITIADYFNVSLDYLVGRTDNPKVNK
nr:helix-turn-helix transcriptional regulator [Sporomusa acidovorans]OZC14675.1 HTH-type transcriptional regulator ImmR [Sporomusa acidovorans DSM 3132]